MDLRRFVDVLLRRSGVVAVAVLAALAAAFGVWRAMPASYSASALLRVPTVPFGSDWRQYDLGYADRWMSTLAALAETAIVRDEVANQLGLAEAPLLEVEVLANTELLRVRAHGATPPAAARAANVLARVLIEFAEPPPASEGRSRPPPPELVEAATPPTAPRGPSLPVTLALAAVLGGLAGLLLAFGAENLDDRLHDPDAIAEALGRPVLAAVPRLARPAGVRLAAPDSRAGRAHRRLRARLLAHDVGGRLSTLLVVSATPGQGASTTVANLAKALADGGRQVVVVDAVPRERDQRRLLGGAGSPRGDGKGARRPNGPVAPVATDVAGVRLVEAKPAEVADMLDDLRHQAHAVLIDGGALGVAAEPAFLGSVVDGVVLVVRAGGVRAMELADAREQLAAVGARVAGAVVTQSRGFGAQPEPADSGAPGAPLEGFGAADRAVAGERPAKNGEQAGAGSADTERVNRRAGARPTKGSG